jgi:hypothetical protein
MLSRAKAARGKNSQYSSSSNHAHSTIVHARRVRRTESARLKPASQQSQQTAFCLTATSLHIVTSLLADGVAGDGSLERPEQMHWTMGWQADAPL